MYFINTGTMAESFSLFLSPIIVIGVIVFLIALKSRTHAKTNQNAEAAAKANAARRSAAAAEEARARAAAVRAQQVRPSAAYAPHISAEGTASDEGTATESLYAQDAAPAAAAVPRTRPEAKSSAIKLDLGRNAIVNAIIMSEVLNPPKAARGRTVR